MSPCCNLLLRSKLNLLRLLILRNPAERHTGFILRTLGRNFLPFHAARNSISLNQWFDRSRNFYKGLHRKSLQLNFLYWKKNNYSRLGKILENNLRGEIPLEPLKKAVFFNFILGEWKRSKFGFFAYIRRHYLTSKKQFFHDRKIQNGGNMTDPVDSVAANIFCGRQLPG